LGLGVKSGVLIRNYMRAAARPAKAVCMACAAAAVFSAAQAKLPPPTADEVAKAAAEAEKAKQQAAQEQAALMRAQDSVAAAYRNDLKRRGITPPMTTTVAPTPQANLPLKAVEPPGSAGPRGGSTQSAESHSGSAK
jgi:hypothetical protein